MSAEKHDETLLATWLESWAKSFHWTEELQRATFLPEL